MAIAFPRLLLRERSHSWNLAGVAATPGVSGNSVAPIIRSDGGGFWTCKMSEVGMTGNVRAQIRQLTLLWRAVRQIADGGVNPLIVPRNDALFRPWPADFPQSAVADLRHSDGTYFSDGSGYYQPTINIVADAAALRATSLDITIVYAGELMGGESFSINHATMGWRLYEIGTVTLTGEDTATITFNPPLREAITDNTLLEFDRPCCTMRLASTNSMDLTVQPWTFNSASVDFVETFQ